MTPDERIDKLQAEVDEVKEALVLIRKSAWESLQLIAGNQKLSAAVAENLRLHWQGVHHGPS